MSANPVRPKGMPRKEWKALSEKQRQKVGRAQPPRAPAPKGKKWYLGIDTAWGSLNAGSGEKKGRSRNVDLVQMAPTESTADRSSKARPQLIMQEEFIAVVDGSTTFSCVQYPIQAGDATYPWLSKVANLYQRYKVRRFEFIFKPTVSQFNSLGSQGRVVLSCDYDAASALIANLSKAQGMDPNVKGLPYENLCLTLDPERCTPGPGGKFVRATLPPVGTDIKTYDAGRLFICTEGLSGAGQIGELHARYAVELMNPILPDTSTAPINNVVSRAASTTISPLVTNVEFSLPFSDFAAFPEGNGLQLGLNGGNIVMRAGIFHVFARLRFNSPAASFSFLQMSAYLNGNLVAGLDTKYQAGIGFGNLSTDVQGQQIITCEDGDILELKGTAIFSSGTNTCQALITLSTV